VLILASPLIVLLGRRPEKEEWIEIDVIVDAHVIGENVVSEGHERDCRERKKQDIDKLKRCNIEGTKFGGKTTAGD
jgi:hypothetical protein